MPRKPKTGQTGRKVYSGPNVPEAQRHTVQIKTRLPPDVAERLRELAGEDGVSAWVVRTVRQEGED